MSGIKHVDFMNKSILYIDLEGSASDFEVIDLGEKAKKLVKLSSRTEVYVLYNLTGMAMTRNLMQHLKSLMEYSDLVVRRVMFGIDPAYKDLIQQVVQSLKMASVTRFSENYVQALQLITNDEEWRNRRQGGRDGYSGPERRHDPANPPSMDQVQSKINRIVPPGK